MAQPSNSMNNDELIRFLLPDAKCRGAIIRGTHIIKTAATTHGLSHEAGALFGQSLLASILLLSVSKGGVRQVLQLDSQQAQAPIQRILCESRSGAVRGYVNWQENNKGQRNQKGGMASWMGDTLHISTVRDLGFGQPYVSTIEHQSEYLADHIVHYLNQSVQTHADVVLFGDLAILIEAMPGCSDDDWFQAVESLAKIPNETLEKNTPEQILESLTSLHCIVVGRDAYAYQCSCSRQQMENILKNMNQEGLKELIDDQN
ncbi:MAG: Hsp33 family molecular chaperone HslO, partial [Mariprofundaceae bacterium]|nr:Hsp33 family molecular chaperone HslO [Mariprofundaceae bacterium]